MLQANDSKYFALGQYAVARFHCKSQIALILGGNCPRVDIWVMLEKGVTITISLRRDVKW